MRSRQQAAGTRQRADAQRVGILTSGELSRLQPRPLGIDPDRCLSIMGEIAPPIASPIALPTLLLNGEKCLSLPLGVVTQYEQFMSDADANAVALEELFLETVGSTVEGKIDVGPVVKLWDEVKVSQSTTASTILAEVLWFMGSQVSQHADKGLRSPRPEGIRGARFGLEHWIAAPPMTAHERSAFL